VFLKKIFKISSTGNFHQQDWWSANRVVAVALQFKKERQFLFDFAKNWILFTQFLAQAASTLTATYCRRRRCRCGEGCGPIN